MYSAPPRTERGTDREAEEKREFAQAKMITFIWDWKNQIWLTNRIYLAIYCCGVNIIKSQDCRSYTNSRIQGCSTCYTMSKILYIFNSILTTSGLIRLRPCEVHIQERPDSLFAHNALKICLTNTCLWVISD